VIHNVERSLESEVQAKEQSISARLYDADLGRIINYFKNDDDDDEYAENRMYYNKKQHHLLKELTLMEFPLNKPILGIICEEINQLTKLELSGVEGLKKSEVLEVIPKLKNIRHFSIRFSYPAEPLLEEDKDQLFQKCSQLDLIVWHLVRYMRDE